MSSTKDKKLPCLYFRKKLDVYGNWKTWNPISDYVVCWACYELPLFRDHQDNRKSK